jgi:hypothetical protein
MKIKKSIVRKILLAAITLLILNLRPAFVGQELNEAVILIPLVFLGILYILLKIPVSVITKEKFVLFGLSLVFSLYLIAQALFIGTSSVLIAAQIGIVVVSVATISTFLFLPKDVYLVLKTITVFFAILAISQIITYSLFLLVGIEKTPLIREYTSIDADRMPWGFKWYFPITVTAGSEVVFGSKMPRAAGIFREPGIYQMFPIFSFFALDYLDIRHKKLLRVMFAFALFTTFSTAGYVIFLSCLLYKYFFVHGKRRILRSFVVLSVIMCAILVVWRMENVGVADKLIDEPRVKIVQASSELFVSNPLVGIGIAQYEGINFIAAVAGIGIIGAVLYLMLVWASISRYLWSNVLTLYLPILLTAFFAQPMYLKGVVIFLLFLSFEMLKEKPRAKREFPRPRESVNPNLIALTSD